MIKNLLVKIVRGKASLTIYKFIFKLFSTLPKKKKLVIFESFHGKQFSDSPRAIYEYMKKHNFQYELIWSVDRRSIELFKNLNVTFVKRFTPKWFWLMPRAKYWVNNVRLPNWLPKPKDTIYIQTWHGTPLKRLGIDIDEVRMPGTDTEKYKKNFISEAKKWDYLISPNRYSTEIFTRAFDYNGKMLETGYPRNDFLYNFQKEDVEKIKKGLNLPLDKKIILYAPTWRDNQYYSVGKYRFDIQLDLEQMRRELGQDYIILLRMHYLIAENLDLSQYEDFAYDVSNYLDIRDLYIISDMLITDYSSVFFDYANLRRPIIFYVYDLDEYRDELRGFYFNLEDEAPGPLTKTTNEVIEQINKFMENENQFSERFDEFYNRFCHLEDGKASERVVKLIFNDKD